MWKYKPCKITQCYKDQDGIIKVFCKEGYLSLRGSGRIVWILSDGVHTVEDIVNELAKESNGQNRETIYQGVIKLINSLESKQLIVSDWNPLYKMRNGRIYNDTEKLDVLLVLAPSAQPGLMIGNKVQGMPPLGLGYIATYLARNGYKCRILDFNIEYVTLDSLKSIIMNQKPEVIGISTTTDTFNNGLLLAQQIKQLKKDTKVFLGGYHVTFAWRKALESNHVDFVVRGEGEKTVLRVCNAFIRGQEELCDIAGISYRKGEQILSNPDVTFISNLDELPFPDRRLFDLDAYAHKGNCSTSRGCPGKCIFCAASGLSGGKYRMRSVKSIVEEFKYLKSLGVKHIDIVDDTMTASIKRLREFMLLLKEENLGITWYCESRVDVMSKEILQEMRDAGLRFIQFGVEAGSQKMLDCLRKNIKIEQIKNVFLWCRELGIETSTCLIIGQPYDTKDSIMDTIEMGKYIKRLGAHVMFTVSTPFPGTYMWDHADELKIYIENENMDHYSTFEPVYSTPELSSCEIRNLYFDAVTMVRKVKAVDDKKTTDATNLIRRDSC